MQVLRLQASVQASQAQLASQAAELECKAALICNLRNDITAACSETEFLSQDMPAAPSTPPVEEPTPSECLKGEPECQQQRSLSRRVLISFPLFLVKSSMKVGVIAAGTLLAERAYEQHWQPAMGSGSSSNQKLVKA